MPSSARAAKPKLSLKGLPPLSKSAEMFVREHPSQAGKLVVAALEAAAVYQGPASASRIPDTLKRFVAAPAPGTDTITISEAASRLKISRTTAYDWIEKKRMIGWKATKAGAIIPAEQIVGPGELVPGLAEVLAVVEDPRVAWRFLSEESPFFESPARPIDLLKQGRVAEVVRAAESHGEAFV